MIDSWGAFPGGTVRPVAPPPEVIGAFDLLRSSLDPAFVQALLADQWMRPVSAFGFDRLTVPQTEAVAGFLGRVNSGEWMPVDLREKNPPETLVQELHAVRALEWRAEA
ncbi:hypothetical protein [Hyalangium versicolor]|uniref:hypothetical protein n=1 Tax=Hyalangium versicolor TaxID=2861190 RepID=UPI001CCE46C0|nr:hypothetical protein [Hyalangium versicolor]